MFSESLKVMLWGMFGIFAVLSLIYIIIKILMKIFPGK